MNRGFVKFVLIFIVVAFIISYFGIDLGKIFASEFVAKIQTFWEEYTKPIFLLAMETIASVIQKIVDFVN